MSIVARVFVVLNLILSVVFVIFALQVWTAQTKWQKMYEEERKENIKIKVAAQAKEIELVPQIVQREEVLKARRQEIVGLKTQLNGLRDSLVECQGRLGEAESRAQMQMALNEELTREIGRRSEQVEKVKNIVMKQQQALEVARANETKARNERAEMENELNALKQQVAQIQRDKRQLEVELAQQTQVIENALRNGVPAHLLLGADVAATQPPLPPARVLAVRPELDLVMLSIGANHNVKPGYKLTISRGDQYLASVEVVKVYPEMCSARLTLKKGEVQVHDEANARVPGIGQ